MSTTYAILLLGDEHRWAAVSPQERARVHVEHDRSSQTPAERGHTLVGVDNLPGAVPLETASLPERTVLVFGQESAGLSEAAAKVCDRVLSISQFGSTRSINVGAAAAIAMHAWVRRHVFGQRATGGG